MCDKIRKNLKILIIMNSLLLLYAIAYTLYFNLTKGSEREIVCVIKSTYGFYCPGCGGSRSLTEFMKLNFIKSFILYPAIPISALLVLGYDARLLISVIKRDSKYTDNYRFYEFILIPIAIILTFALRNILLLGFGIDIVGDILPKV